MAHGFDRVEPLEQDTGLRHPDGGQHICERDQKEESDGDDVQTYDERLQDETDARHGVQAESGF